jgi:hypothetical protein
MGLLILWLAAAIFAVRFGLLPLQLGRMRLLLQLLLPMLLSRLPILLSPLLLPLVCCRPLPLRFRIKLSLPLLSRFPLLALDLSLLPLHLVLIVGPHRGGRHDDAEPGQKGGAQKDSEDGFQHGSTPLRAKGSGWDSDAVARIDLIVSSVILRLLPTDGRGRRAILRGILFTRTG